MQHSCENSFSLPILHQHINNYPMNACISIISMSVLSLMLLSCQPQKANPLLIEAYDYHQQAGQIRKNLAQQLADAKVDSSKLAKLEELKQLLKEWDDSWVEVPGFEHDHEHEKVEHEHHHNPAPNLSPKEHLELQKHLLEKIKSLDKSFKND